MAGAIASLSRFCFQNKQFLGYFSRRMHPRQRRNDRSEPDMTFGEFMGRKELWPRERITTVFARGVLSAVQLLVIALIMLGLLYML